MTFFFLVVGLEARREFDLGALRERPPHRCSSRCRRCGGMAAAVLIYLAFNAGGDGAHGWGAAMSTDTAFALGRARARRPRSHPPAGAAAVDRRSSTTSSRSS